MSADNWRECPRCAIGYLEEINRLKLEVEARYGKVPVDEFDEFRREVDSFIYNGVEHEFREDYEIYSEETTVYMHYSGFCRTCKYKVKFDREVAMEEWHSDTR